MLSRKLLGALFISIVLVSCTRTTNPTSSSSLSSTSSGNVTMSVVFSNSGTPVGLSKVGSVTPGVDSIRIDSAIVVFARIQFESDIDTVTVNTNGGFPFINININDTSLTFPGPFVVHVRDTVAIDFASRTLPAGTYNGIKFDVGQLGPGRRFQDSDIFNHRVRDSSVVIDTSATNFSIVIWGSVYKDSAWVPFEFKDNQNLEYKVKGTFTIATATSSINIALNFNMGTWFIGPNGNLLDPTDTSFRNYAIIQQAIGASFGNGRCGRWDDFWAWGFGHGH